MELLVKLEPYQETSENQQALQHYVLTNPLYTIQPEKKIVEIKDQPRQQAVLIRLITGELVGFFCLSSWPDGEDYTANQQAVLFRAMSIDERYRGQHYGQQALALLGEFVKRHYPECNEVVLGVNVNNQVATGLYLASGFVETGRRLLGVLGAQKILSYTIK